MIEYSERNFGSVIIKNVVFHKNDSIQVGKFYIDKVDYCVNDCGQPRGGCFYKVTKGLLKDKDRFEKNFENIFSAIKFCLEQK